MPYKQKVKAERDERLNDDSTTATIPGVAPPVVARDGAILHTAIYEAVNALSNNPSGSSLDSLPIIPEGASQEAAAVGSCILQFLSESIRRRKSWVYLKDF